MCGRFTLTVTWEELMNHFLIDAESLPPFHTPKYNVAPTQMVAAVIHDGRSRRIGQLRWGLIPSWAKDASAAAKMINARSETLENKPAYKTPFLRKRCLIPADSFYEWKKQDALKIPYRICRKDGGIFSMAGLYDIWTAPDGSRVSSCTVITTTPNQLMEPIHNRMPVILDREHEDLWLNRNASADELKSLLIPYPDDDMQAVRVSMTVNSVRNDSPECIQSVTEE
ncbi:SOS response-associated peptidase [Paenibacillus lemnae]|uniref:Abasic site processing protein n=1 Tax=Paenibacillus lemnae TaxID=1330551 RepID=A0A848M2Z3_PAELE|nr:SOS response-associated peptidase [Paenibacillus lemnae]NMO94639.1 SOS response-associated peptidase [Paenibacillus lemnae]